MHKIVIDLTFIWLNEHIIVRFSWKTLNNIGFGIFHYVEQWMFLSHMPILPRHIAYQLQWFIRKKNSIRLYHFINCTNLPHKKTILYLIGKIIDLFLIAIRTSSVFMVIQYKHDIQSNFNLRSSHLRKCHTICICFLCVHYFIIVRYIIICYQCMTV